MNQPDNQSIIIEGGSEAAHAGLLDDLTVQDADAIKGGAPVADPVFVVIGPENHYHPPNR